MGRGEHPRENHHKELNPKTENSNFEIQDSDFNNVILGMLERTPKEKKLKLTGN